MRQDKNMRQDKSKMLPDRFIKFMKNEFGYWLGIVSALITIFSAWNIGNISSEIWVLWLFLIGITIIIICLRFIQFLENSIVTIKELQEYYSNIIAQELNLCHQQYKDCAEEIHKYLHNMRDNLCSISFATSNNSDYLEQILKNTCNEIELIFSKLWIKNKVSVCVKRIVVKTQMNQDFRQWEVETIARSTNTKHSRNNNNKKPVLITENSDFMIIVSPEYEDSVFSCTNLNKVKQEFLETYNEVYRNSTYNFLDYYQSTIVVPIRIQSDKINPKLKKNGVDNINYHLVGFLCIDTEEIFEEPEPLFDTGIELAKAFADIMYKLIENSLVAEQTAKEGAYCE